MQFGVTPSMHSPLAERLHQQAVDKLREARRIEALESEKREILAEKERRGAKRRIRLDRFFRRITQKSYPQHSRIPDTTPNARAIVAAVARKHGLTLNDLCCAMRSRPLVRARQEAMYEVMTRTMLSQPQIGRIFHREHTTIRHGVVAHAKASGLPIPRGLTYAT